MIGPAGVRTHSMSSVLVSVIVDGGRGLVVSTTHALRSNGENGLEIAMEQVSRCISEQHVLGVDSLCCL